MPGSLEHLRGRQVGVQPLREEGRHVDRQKGQPALIEGYRQDGEQDPGHRTRPGRQTRRRLAPFVERRGVVAPGRRRWRR